MKRLAALLTLAGLIAACDADVTPPPAEIVTLVTVSGGPGDQISAVLLSVDVAVDEVVASGREMMWVDGERTVVAVVPHSPGTGLTLELKTAGVVPAVELLQAADLENELYADLTAFTVDTRQEEEE